LGCVPYCAIVLGLFVCVLVLFGPFAVGFLRALFHALFHAFWSFCCGLLACVVSCVLVLLLWASCVRCFLRFGPLAVGFLRCFMRFGPVVVGFLRAFGVSGFRYLLRRFGGCQDIGLCMLDDTV